MPLYRPNIAAILQDPKDKILVAERITIRGAWQFPQGGVDDGEELIDALRREVREELGVTPDRYEPIRCRTGYRYEFPAYHRRNGVWDGQEQTYFLCRFHGTDHDIDLAQPHPEFASYRWIAPEEFRLSWLPDFKRAVYQQVFQDFFGLELPEES